MSKTIKLSKSLINDAVTYGKTQNRSAAKQIEYWARIGKMADENPELPLTFLKGILVGLEENKAGDVSDYKFG
jgi:hypothetical protein